MSSESHYDVVIMGAGIGGSWAARHLMLKMPGIRVALVEPKSDEALAKIGKIGESSVEIAGIFMDKELGLGAYLTETFRGGIMAVSRGEIEAGHAYGLTSIQVFLRITFPAMVRHALPGFSNNWLVLAKTTALVSVMGLHDMVFNARQAGGATRQPFTFYFLVAILLLVITGVSDLGLRWVERRYSVGVRKT